jgi:ABC-type branched-subunit amino acid transport system substrate-binding protein
MAPPGLLWLTSYSPAALCLSVAIAVSQPASFALSSFLSPTPNEIGSPSSHDQGETVRIGLLIPPGADGLAARRAAELAVADAERTGGMSEISFELAIREVAGPWGSGSKEIVSLVFEDEVLAIVAALDGRGAHVAEQIVAKGQVPLVAPTADPSLTQINVPWFFRCAPDDRAQSAALAVEVYGQRGLLRVATVTDNSYDAQVAEETFTDTAADAGFQVSLRLAYTGTADDFSTLVAELTGHQADAVVLFGPPSPAAKLIRQLHATGQSPALFGHMSLADRQFLSLAGSDVEGMVLVAPGHWQTSRGETFVQRFRTLYEQYPGPTAAYIYDGMSASLNAIRRAGLDRNDIRAAMLETREEGVTGIVQFDANGNRVGPVGLVEIVAGQPRKVR